jgi:hypothetical protein
MGGFINGERRVVLGLVADESTEIVCRSFSFPSLLIVCRYAVGVMAGNQKMERVAIGRI